MDKERKKMSSLGYTMLEDFEQGLIHTPQMRGRSEHASGVNGGYSYGNYSPVEFDKYSLSGTTTLYCQSCRKVDRFTNKCNDCDKNLCKGCMKNHVKKCSKCRHEKCHLEKVCHNGHAICVSCYHSTSSKCQCNRIYCNNDNCRHPACHICEKIPTGFHTLSTCCTDESNASLVTCSKCSTDTCALCYENPSTTRHIRTIVYTCQHTFESKEIDTMTPDKLLECTKIHPLSICCQCIPIKTTTQPCPMIGKCIHDIRAKQAALISCPICYMDYTRDKLTHIHDGLHDPICYTCLSKLHKCPFCRKNVEHPDGDTKHETSRTQPGTFIITDAYEAASPEESSSEEHYD